MTSTSVLRTTVREARPEEAGAVAALVRDGYTAYADELPPDLLRTWVDEVADPGGGVTFVAVVDGALAGTARLHLAGTYPVPLPGGSAGGPRRRRGHRRTAEPAWRAC